MRVQRDCSPEMCRREREREREREGGGGGKGGGRRKGWM